MFEVETFSYLKQIYPFEWVMLTIYMLVLLGISFFIQVSNIKKQPVYRYYLGGVAMKAFSAVVFCLIYIYYYNGGDTVCYYETSRALVNLGMKDPASFWKVMTTAPSVENYFLFDDKTGFPWAFMYYDTQTFFVAKLIAPILFVAFRSYLVSGVVLSWLSFFGIWRFFLMLCRHYPAIEKRLALGVIFVPSVLFWGSGILKDTITFSAVCWFIVGIEGFFILKKSRLKNAAIFIVASYVLISIKAYIMISLLPGVFLWLLYSRFSRFKSYFLRYMSVPFIVIFSLAAGYGLLSVLGDSLGKFSVAHMLETASITQRDLKQDYYHGSSFDIGEFDPTISGVISKAPAAMAVGLFRPFIWEAHNVVMLVSGLENLVYLSLTLMLFARFIMQPKKFFRTFFNDPLLLFMFTYTLLFSVLVGLSTSNFGALVRFKIPFLPAFICFLLILNYKLARKRSGAPAGDYSPLVNPGTIRYDEKTGIITKAGR
ncbi:MAG TPA: hypothetical protein VFU15_17295 [Bacteroidia bacterium]|nr:hypothetical protein [Bacteroidia bacterium]